MTSSREGHYRVEACSEGTMFDVPTRERGEVTASGTACSPLTSSLRVGRPRPG
jgi:hypothetical protein